MKQISPGHFVTVPMPEDIITQQMDVYMWAILVHLCDYANKKGECFPGMNTIAKRCNIDRVTVWRKIKEMKKLGIISTQERKILQSKIGRKTSLLYTIHVNDLWLVVNREDESDS